MRAPAAARMRQLPRRRRCMRSWPASRSCAMPRARHEALLQASTSVSLMCHLGHMECINRMRVPLHAQLAPVSLA